MARARCSCELEAEPPSRRQPLLHARGQDRAGETGCGCPRGCIDERTLDAHGGQRSPGVYVGRAESSGYMEANARERTGPAPVWSEQVDGGIGETGQAVLVRSGQPRQRCTGVRQQRYPSLLDLGERAIVQDDDAPRRSLPKPSTHAAADRLAPVAHRDELLEASDVCLHGDGGRQVGGCNGVPPRHSRRLTALRTAVMAAQPSCGCFERLLCTEVGRRCRA